MKQGFLKFYNYFLQMDIDKTITTTGSSKKRKEEKKTYIQRIGRTPYNKII